jgi:glycosyltransferase involved in cell wall biosynthesis
LGAHARALTDLVQKLELQSHVQLNGQVPHPEAVRAMGVCDVLVLYNEEPIQFKISMIAGKTYEYLRSGKPVIAIGPPGDNLDIIEKYASRHEIVRTHNCEEIVLAINRLYDDWVSDKLPTYAASKDEYAERFNREALTAALVSCFNRVLNRKQSS